MGKSLIFYKIIMQEPHIRHVASRSPEFRTPSKKTRLDRVKTFLSTTQKKHILMRIFGILLLLAALGILILWGFFIRGAPAIESLESGDYFRESTTIYDKDGGLIYSLFKDGKRTYVTSDAISQSLKDAIVSTEDRTFFENPGIDLLGLIRAGAKYAMGSNETVK